MDPAGKSVESNFRIPQKQQLDEVIDELVPPSVRGKETGRKLWIFGGYSMSSKLYEHVTISEPLESDQSTSGPGVTIIFNRADCH